jgi:hypothetical protein
MIRKHPSRQEPLPKEQEEGQDHQVENRRVVRGVEGIDTAVAVGPLPLTVQDGVVQLEALALVVIVGPAEEFRRVGDVDRQVEQEDDPRGDPEPARRIERGPLLCGPHGRGGGPWA